MRDDDVVHGGRSCHVIGASRHGVHVAAAQHGIVPGSVPGPCRLLPLEARDPHVPVPLDASAPVGSVPLSRDIHDDVHGGGE